MMLSVVLAFLLSATPVANTPDASPSENKPQTAKSSDAGVGARAVVEIIAEGVISTELNDYSPSFSPDGRLMVFGRSEPNFEHAKIMVSEYRDGRWTTATTVPFADQRYSDSDPTLSPDGKTLYFISDRPSPDRGTERKDYDIWRVQRTTDGWGQLEHLGPEVNSVDLEFGPALNGNTLYFCSTRPGGKGKLDIYSAAVAGNGFKPAEEVAAWNSEASEGDPELSKSGDLALFWSRRPGHSGAGSLFVSEKRDGKWTTPAPIATGPSSDALDFTPAFSPDGEWIYFASTRKDAERNSPVLNGESNIYRVRTSDVLKRRE